eukprot:scaffold9563_cov150-Skeletonema_marinoi.AAC.10
MLVELDDEHTKCGICVTKFSSDRDNKDPEIRKHLPVLSSSQRCDHWFCHGCILREQLRVADENNGKVPKWIRCMHCREKTSFNPAEPKYHRLLIDLLARAQKYAAAQVKNEEQESCVDMQLDLGSSNAMCMKRESDAVDDEDEREMKRPKLLAPSPQLVQVKEEPVESDDHYAPPPLVDSASPMSEMSQSATTADANDEPQSLVCSKCKVLKERRCFTGRSRKKGDAAVCKECNLNDHHRTIRKMKEALNAAMEMEELEKMKSAYDNIAIAAKTEGLGDSIENNGDRTAQLTRAVRNAELPYPRNNEPVTNRSNLCVAGAIVNWLHAEGLELEASQMKEWAVSQNVLRIDEQPMLKSLEYIKTHCGIANAVIRLKRPSLSLKETVNVVGNFPAPTILEFKFLSSHQKHSVVVSKKLVYDIQESHPYALTESLLSQKLNADNDEVTLVSARYFYLWKTKEITLQSCPSRTLDVVRDQVPYFRVHIQGLGKKSSERRKKKRKRKRKSI